MKQHHALNNLRLCRLAMALTVLAGMGMAGCQWQNDTFDNFVDDGKIEFCPPKVDENGDEIKSYEVDENGEPILDENGNKIPRLKYIVVNKCTDETNCCQKDGTNCEGVDDEGNPYTMNFKEVFNKGLCPKDYVCSKEINKDIYFCIQGCPVNQHTKNNECVSDSEKACGSESNNCTEQPWWTEGKGHCINAKCVPDVDGCANGYKYNPEKKQCESGCPREDQHLAGSQCVDDTPEACGSEEYNCTIQPWWLEGDCINKNCVPKENSCANGYQYNQEKKQCESGCPENYHFDNTSDNVFFISFWTKNVGPSYSL